MKQTDNHVTIIEVGPRDGLQNEAQTIDLATKIELINRLSETGLKTIEAGSFVSPKWVPQMANSADVFRSITHHNHISYPVLVPNMQGLEDALSVGAKEISVFISASEGFSQKNINCSIDESFKRIQPVCQKAHEENINIRGYISCIMDCPYDGKTSPEQVLSVAKRLLDLDVDEISLGDTIGTGTPETTEALFNLLLKTIPASKLALHLHDTHNNAMACIEQGLKMGIRRFDSSVGGLGGCPYAKNATGNVATEKVVLYLHHHGYETGVDLEKLEKVSDWIKGILNK